MAKLGFWVWIFVWQFVINIRKSINFILNYCWTLDQLIYKEVFDISVNYLSLSLSLPIIESSKKLQFEHQFYTVAAWKRSAINEEGRLQQQPQSQAQSSSRRTIHSDVFVISLSLSRSVCLCVSGKFWWILNWGFFFLYRTQSGTFKDGDLLVNRDGVRIVSQSEVEAVRNLSFAA